MHKLLKSQEVDINRIFESHAAGLKGVEESLRGLFSTNVQLINTIGGHLVASGGKRIRPLFTLTSAALAGYTGSDHIRLAAIVESIHTASLLHDDVVDGADLRRGRPTAHSIWGNQTVILVGDYLYSNALRQAVLFRNQDIMDSLSAATTGMTRGELMQLQYSSDAEITEETYLEIISAKTGGLVSAACRIGGIVAGVASDKEEALASYGMKVGTAFQMADDILDYMADEGDLGKGLGRDLDEGKVTLPLICLYRAASEAERQELASILEQDLSEKGLNRILELFERYGVLEESIARAKRLVEDAKGDLDVFPSSPQRQDMYELADYALGRVK
jgi:octaprenyl-diphosphate synthase